MASGPTCLGAWFMGLRLDFGSIGFGTQIGLWTQMGL